MHHHDEGHHPATQSYQSTIKGWNFSKKPTKKQYGACYNSSDLDNDMIIFYE
jgi:hypothetical protein